MLIGKILAYNLGNTVLLFSFRHVSVVCKNSDTWNNWLIAVQFNSKSDRDTFLKITNENKIGTRPIWKLMNKLPMYKNSYYANLDCCENLESLIVNIPSGLPNKFGLPKLTTN